MATRSVGKDRTAVQRPRHGHPGRARAGHAPVTEWTSCWNALRSCSVHLAHQGGFPPLQSAPLQAPPSPSPSLFTPVSMRPFLGRLWPPSRCVFESGGPGTAGVFSGECGSPHLQRRRGQSGNQSLGPRYGSQAAQRHWQQEA